MGFGWKVRTRAKYGAKKVESSGYSFASKGEAACFHLLKLLEAAGEIKVIQVQPQVYLTDAEILYKPDFLIEEIPSRRAVYVEFKGFETPEWRIKRRLWKCYGPALLRVYKGSASRLAVHEEIEPKERRSA